MSGGAKANPGERGETPGFRKGFRAAVGRVEHYRLDAAPPFAPAAVTQAQRRDPAGGLSCRLRQPAAFICPANAPKQT